MNQRISQTETLARDLGLDEELFPAPLHLETSPPGEDEFHQSIIDGSFHDDLANIPGMEDDALVELRDGIDPDDEESMQAIQDDIEETNRLAENCEVAHERLTDIADEVKQRGAISRDDVQRAVEAFPGLNEYIPNINSFSTSYTLTGFDAGLNALTNGQKAAGGGILIAVIAVLFKVIAATYRIITQRASMNSKDYKDAIRTPQQLSKELEAAKKDVNELLRRSKDPNKLAERIAANMKKKYPNFEFHQRQVNTLDGEAIADVILADKLKENYLAVYNLIGGVAVAGVKVEDLVKMFQDLPTQLTTYSHNLRQKIEAAASDFKKDGELNIKDYTLSDGSINELFKDFGGYEQTGNKLKAMLVKIDTPVVQPAVKYMGTSIDLGPSIDMDKSILADIKAIIAKKSELENSLKEIQSTNDPDKIKNRAEIVRTLTHEYNVLQLTLNNFETVRDKIKQLFGSIRGTIKEYLAFCLNASNNP